MESEIAVGLVTAAICFVAGLIARSTYTRVRQLDDKRSREAHVRRTRAGRATDWLETYYDGDEGAGLFQTHVSGSRVVVPVLTDPRWQTVSPSCDELLIQSIPHRVSDSRVSRAFIVRRFGRLRLWNDYIVSAKSITCEENGLPQINVELCSYFQFLTASGRLEAETIKAARRRSHRTPLRDRYMGDSDQVGRLELPVHGLGMQVTFTVERADGVDCLLQRRSDAVATYADSFAVCPVFACQTIDLSPRTQVDLFHNFMRELYEEVLGGSEVERGLPTVADPRWFYSTDFLRDLSKMHDSEDPAFRFVITGICINALNGEVNIAAHAHMTAASPLAATWRSAFKGNWEIAHLEVADLFGPRIDELLTEGTLQPGSAFSILQARSHLAAMDLA